MDTEKKLRNPGGDTHEEFDRDVNLRGVVYTGGALVAVTVLSFVLMWFFFKGLASYEERRDPEPSPMPEAAEQARPAGTTLQATPERELADLRRLEQERLESYGLSEDGASARIPIERAMELTLARGLGTPDGEIPGESPVAAGAAAGDVDEALEDGLEGDAPTPLPASTEGEADEDPDTTTPATPEGPDGN